MDNYYNEFHKYIYWVGSFIPQPMQNEAFGFLCNCKEEYIPYIFDIGNVHNWDNAIVILEKIGYPKNKTALFNIMHMLQDINWPKTENALSIIKKIYENEPEYVIEIIKKVTYKAYQYNDSDWIFGICFMKEKLKIEDFNFDDDILNIFASSHYYDN